MIRHITKRAIAYLNQIDSPYNVPLQERACESEIDEIEDVGINTIQVDKDWESKVTCPECQEIISEFREFIQKLKKDSELA